LSNEQFQNMYDSQHGLCYICQQPCETLGVDHNHNTNEIRKLLCNSCNLGLGLFKENKEFLKSAINYLIEHEHNN
jgi:hypothetical protein